MGLKSVENLKFGTDHDCQVAEDRDFNLDPLIPDTRPGRVFYFAVV